MESLLPGLLPSDFCSSCTSEAFFYFLRGFMRSRAGLSVAPAFAYSSIRDSSAEISILFFTLVRMQSSYAAELALRSALT